MNSADKPITEKEYQTIKVEKQYTYVSDLPESITSQFDNSYIDKTLTGCGFTTWILQNPESYIVAVHFKGLIDCKVEQANNDTTGFYPHKIFPIHSDISDTLKVDLEYYLQSHKTHKIMVTYDSVPKLLEWLNSFDKKYHAKEFKLLVDECHKVLEFAGNFKARAIDALENSFKHFKSMIAVTATPSRIEYIPVGFYHLNPIKLDWEQKTQVSIKHERINTSQVKPAVISIALKHLKNEIDGNAYFFVNSVKFAVAVVKQLIEGFGFDRNDFNIICGKSVKNDKLLKKLKLKPKNILTDFCKINFVTSTAFEGQDFMDPDGKTYIISTGQLEHTRIDISTQFPQIVGRLRCSKYKNQVNFIWSYAITNGITNFEEYHKMIIDTELAVDDTELKFNTYNDYTRSSVLIRAQKDIWFLNDETDVDRLYKNHNASKCLLNSFVGTQFQYFTHYDHAQSESKILENTRDFVDITLNAILGGKVQSTKIVPEMDAVDKMKMNKVPNFSKIVKEYTQALFDIQFNRVVMNSRQGCELNNFINEIDSNYPEVTEYVKSVGIQKVLSYTGNSVALSAKAISKNVNKINQNKLIADAIQSEFKAGEVIVSTDIKDRLSSAFAKHGITDVTPKRNQFELVFDVRITTTKNGSAIKLQQKQ